MSKRSGVGEIEYTYTRGMDDEAVARRLTDAETGVLALAAGDDAYAIPVAFHRENDRVYFRLAIHEGSEKAAYLESTARAALVVYDTEPPDDSWSVVLRGPIGPAERDLDDGTINALFTPLRVFDEAIEAVEPTVYELAVETVTGRTT
ncbi:MAG: pyridoxamine 5'-phosphate oxidase family protein [Halalkalicoccus sp.]|nr:pyridoxamine 5'-phosphate oxidase family protein [Halalkalicoccus sp.]